MDEKINKSIQFWLKGGLFLVAVMLLLGGSTRLTGSGLSMVTWDLLWGIFPPLSQSSWQRFFEAYKESPEYLKVNFAMKLVEFKQIFWLEYLHRVVGRIVGLYFLVPLFFALDRKRTLQLMTGFGLVLFQGIWGWLMVQSGLKYVPYVNPFFLSGHLMLAALLVLWIIWEYSHRPKISGLYIVYIGVLLAEIFLGGLVAGFKAGHIYNTFPLMEGQWFPQEVQSWGQLWVTPEGVQWLHRVGAGLVFLLLSYYAAVERSKMLFFCLLFQVFLGVYTLLFKIPLILALLHQLNAFVLLGLTSLFIFFKKK